MSAVKQQLHELALNLELATAKSGTPRSAWRLLAHWLRLGAAADASLPLHAAWQDTWQQAWTDAGIEMPLKLPIPIPPSEPAGFALFADEQEFSIVTGAGKALLLSQIEVMSTSGRRIPLRLGHGKSLEFTAVGDRYLVDALAPEATAGVTLLTFVHKAPGGRRLVYSDAATTRLVGRKRTP